MHKCSSVECGHVDMWTCGHVQVDKQVCMCMCKEHKGAHVHSLVHQ